MYSVSIIYLEFTFPSLRRLKLFFFVKQTDLVGNVRVSQSALIQIQPHSFGERSTSVPGSLISFSKVGVHR